MDSSKNTTRFFLLIILFTTISHVKADSPTDSIVPEPLWKNKGILFRLTIFKSAVERTATAEFASATLSAAEKQQLIQNYNNLQSTLDASLTSFQFKMNGNNWLANKFYRMDKLTSQNVDESISMPSNIKNQVMRDLDRNLNTYLLQCELFLAKPHSKPTVGKGKDTPVDPLALLTDIGGVLQFVLTFQATKAATLSTLLDKVRLSQPKDIFSK